MEKQIFSWSNRDIWPILPEYAIDSIQFNPIQSNPIQSNSIQFNSIQFNSMIQLG